jgi:hypothetical protein
MIHRGDGRAHHQATFSVESSTQLLAAGTLVPGHQRRRSSHSELPLLPRLGNRADHGDRWGCLAVNDVQLPGRAACHRPRLHQRAASGHPVAARRQRLRKAASAAHCRRECLAVPGAGCDAARQRTAGRVPGRLPGRTPAAQACSPTRRERRWHTGPHSLDQLGERTCPRCAETLKAARSYADSAAETFHLNQTLLPWADSISAACRFLSGCGDRVPTAVIRRLGSWTGNGGRYGEAIHL